MKKPAANGFAEYLVGSLGPLGTIYVLEYGAQEKSVVELLHETVEAVTGKPVPKPEPRKIGFY